MFWMQKDTLITLSMSISTMQHGNVSSEHKPSLTQVFDGQRCDFPTADVDLVLT